MKWKCKKKKKSQGNLTSQHMMVKRPELSALFNSVFTEGITYDQMANTIATAMPQTDLDDGLKSMLIKLKTSLEDWTKIQSDIEQL